MKFSHAWATTAKENLSLKIACVLLSISTTAFCLLSLKLSLKQPMIIERGDESEVAKVVNSEHTQKEIKAFLKKALEHRFNTKQKPSVLFLSFEEMMARDKEQTELADKKIKQNIIIEEINFNDKQILVNADRVFSVGEVRSAFTFPLTVEIESTDRSIDNPYGLLLQKVTLLKKELK